MTNEYSWKGTVIKLSKKDYDAWKKNYHAIPDLNAMLYTIDTWLTDQPEEKKKKWWYTALSWLNREHQDFMLGNKAKENINGVSWL